MSKRKTIIIVVSAVLAVALIVLGISYATSASRRTCNVYSVSDIAMTDYWGDNNTTYGEVRSDKVQTIYLSDTQQVTEVYVHEGQSVQVGDKLLAYDTTLSGLEVSRKELAIQQMQEELTAAKKKYNSLAGSKVYTVSATQLDAAPVQLVLQQEEPTYRLMLLGNVTKSPDTEADSNQDENSTVQTYIKCGGSGTQESPFLYVCANGIPFGEAFLREIGLLPPEGEEGGSPGPIYVVFGISEGNQADGKIMQAGGMCFTRYGDDVSFIVFDASDYIGRPFGEEKPAAVCEHSYKGSLTAPTCTEKGYITYTCTKCGHSYQGEEIAALGHSYSNGTCIRCGAKEPNTENNGSNNNSGTNNSGTNNGGSTNGGSTNNNSGSNNQGLSYAEIQAQKAELQQKIKELDLELRMAEVELKRMKQELSDGIVYAEMAGTIASVLDVDSAYQSGEPLIKLAGGGGYYLQGTISELELDNVYVGQRVTVTSWESGETYEGVVESISDIPTDNGYYYGSGNTNVSFYPFFVTIDGTANLREYETVDMQLEMDQEQVVTDAFYLEQPFVLQEDGRSYVYVADEDGKLQKRYITTGITLWGSSIQILDGLTLDDAIAFPYGKNAVEGAKTQLSTLDELYGW